MSKMFRCPGAITEKIVRKAYAAVLKVRPVAGLYGEDSVTARGFGLVNFLDDSGTKCSLQISSSVCVANEDNSVDNQQGWIWLGIDNPNPIILKTKALDIGMPLPPGEVSGWMLYPMPDYVQISTRMYLSAASVRGLITRLQTWLDTGSFRPKQEQPLGIIAKPADQEQLAKTKAELDQLIEEHKEPIAQENRDFAAAGEQDQPIGTIAKPADPPPSSELPRKTVKSKIKVKIAMNIDLIAEYFCWAAQLREEEWYLDGEPAGLSRIRAERKANELREKKSALEAKIMEKLMAK